MKSLKTLRNQKGFSLVELMVVVAIIGILAVIGIPQYQKFMSKARQAEAKSHLNALFQGESSFFTEYNIYTSNINAIGLGAVGIGLRYNAGFDIDACTDYPAVNPPAPAGAAGNNDLIAVAPPGATWYWAATGITDPAADISTCVATLNAQSYTGAAWGNPTNTAQGVANMSDQFTINNVRRLVQVAIGI
jgi:type IV pilus assembly protein PilA